MTIFLNLKFQGVTVPVVCCAHALFGTMGITGTPTSEHSSQTGQSQVTIADPTHPMAGGYSGSMIPVLTTGRPFSWGRPGTSAAKVARLVSDATKWLIFGYETGATLPAAPGVAPARRVGFFLGNTSAQSLNTTGTDLLNAAIRWAAGVPSPVTEAVTSRNSDGSVQISWGLVAGATSYQILRGPASGGPFGLIATGISGGSYRDLSAVPGQNYVYVVQAGNAGGFSANFVLPMFFAAREPVFVLGPSFLRWGEPGAPTTLWNEGLYEFDAGLFGGGVTIVPNSTNLVQMTSIPLTITKVTDLTWRVTIQPSSGFGSKPTFSFTGTTAPNSPVSQILGIRCEKRPMLHIRFRFPENPANNATQCNRVANLFSDDDGLRDAARQSVVMPFIQAISNYNSPNGLAAPPSPAMEQAGVGFYPVTTSLDPGAPGEIFPANWFVGNNFLAGFNMANGRFAFTPSLRAVHGTKTSATEINVYFVRQLTWTGIGNVNGVAYTEPDLLQRRTILISDNAIASDLIHELGHLFGLEHTNWERTALGIKVEDASLGNPKGRVAAAQYDNYNIMWQFSPSLATRLTSGQCDRIGKATRGGHSAIAAPSPD